MRRAFLTVAALLLLYCPVLGQITVEPEYQPHQPIVATLTAQTPDGAQLIARWDISKPAQLVVLDGGLVAHIWAPPGSYEIECEVITIQWEAKEFNIADHSAEFQVTGATPEPGPGPATPFKAAVRAALDSVQGEYRGSAPDVAEVYAGIAKEAEQQPDSWDPAAMVNEAKVRNASVPNLDLNGWRAFWPALGRAMANLRLSSDDLAGHIKAFRDVAEVLNAS